MKNPKEIFNESLVRALSADFGSLSESDIESSISYCDPNFGELSSNICFRLAKSEAKNPVEIAQAIIDSLKNDSNIEHAEFLEPGFINVRLNITVWVKYLDSIGADFAKSELGKGKSVQLEFISANPTGPLVLTNAWQGYYGDILANIYASQGYKAEREYYLNDGGNQIIALGRAIQQALGAEFEAEIADNLYRGEYIDKIAEVITREYGNSDRVKSAEPMEVGKKTAELIIDQHIKPDLARLEVSFDTMYSESKPDIEKTLTRLKDAGLIKKNDGAMWLDGNKVGLKQDEVLVRSYDKGYTYFVKDIAYQLERLEDRGFDSTITIVGPDHHGQAIRLVNTLKALGHDNFTEISTQTIRLIKDGKEFKMSKRKGNYILLDEFLDMVPTEAARFYFAMRDTNTHMDFDVDLVKEHSAKNPVYYALYAYARACSIQQKATEANLKPADSLEGYELSAVERKLVLELSKVPSILAEITTSHKVHQLLHHTVEVAKVFHEFYELERVVGNDQATQKLLVIKQFKQAYEAIFEVIGVGLLEKM